MPPSLSQWVETRMEAAGWLKSGKWYGKALGCSWLGPGSFRLGDEPWAWGDVGTSACAVLQCWQLSLSTDPAFLGDGGNLGGNSVPCVLLRWKHTQIQSWTQNTLGNTQCAPKYRLQQKSFRKLNFRETGRTFLRGCCPVEHRWLQDVCPLFPAQVLPHRGRSQEAAEPRQEAVLRAQAAPAGVHHPRHGADPAHRPAPRQGGHSCWHRGLAAFQTP